jgi:HK97 family phage portal protein
MNWISRFFGAERRAKTARTSDPYVAEFFGQRGMGGPVTADNVLSNSAVATACVRLRSESLASVGLHLFRRTPDGGRERADENPLYSVLHDLWNPNLSAFEGRELMVRDLDLFGNSFNVVERDARGAAIALHPVPPRDVTIERLPNGRLRYRVAGNAGGPQAYLAEEILHVRGPTKDGVWGQSPLQIARGALALGLSQAETAQKLLDNGLRISGVLSYPHMLNMQNYTLLRAHIEKRTGATNAGQLLIVDSGGKYEPMSWSPEDAEFLETRKLSNLDVARLFGCPPTTVGIPDHATYSNQEQEATALVRNALGPLAARIEAAMQRCLLTEAGRRSLYIEHDLSTLLRGDVKSRYDAYRIGREIGALSANDVRRRENEPPVAGGDDYHMPANWVRLGAPPAQTGGGV